jgi:ATP-dependent Clp protease ATP-binding subunit ClpB
MTSNVGSHFIAEQVGQGRTSLDEGVRRQVMEALREHFRPEFLNRLDEIILFHPLSREEMRQIIDVQLRGLMKRLEDRKIHVEVSDRAKDLLIAEGYDPIYGARPLKRTIQRRVLDALAIKVLEGEFREGDTVRIDAPAGELTFEAAQLTHG